MLCLLTTLALAANVLTASGPITVDGVLDEAEWALAEPVTDFARFQPADGGAPPGITEVRFVQDARNLYVGIHVDGADYPIRARVSPREDINADDQVGIYLDPWGAARSGFVFYLNPLGIQQDIQVANGRWNMAWDTVLRSRGHVTEHGYEIELAIPFRSLKYPRDADTWGVIVTRKVPSEGAKYASPHVERNHPQLLSQAMPLSGVHAARRGSGLEVQPGLAIVQSAAREAPEDALPWTGFQPIDTAVRPSLDVRVGLTESTTLTATINPDFSDVEFDVTPIDLNRRFPFFFEERRPFFLEGGGFFEDAAGTLYTRSIVDPLAGLKLAGREGPFDVALLHAIDRAPAASFTEGDTPGFGADDVDGEWAANTLGRASVDVGDGGWVAVTVADKRLVDVDRDGTGGSHHDSVGVEAAIPLGRRWTATANNQQAFTGPRGDTTWGQASYASLFRPEGDGFGMWVEAGDVTQGYRKELGFQEQAGLTQGGVGVSYSAETDGVIDIVTPGMGTWHTAERNGDRFHGGWAEVDATLGGIHELGLGVALHSFTETGVTVGGWSAEADYGAEWTRAVSASTSVSVGRELDYDTLLPASELGASASTTLRPTTNLRFDLSGSLSRFAPEGQPVEWSGRVRLRTQAQFTRELGLRLVGEHVDPGDDPARLTGSALLTWLLHPGTAVNIGYTERAEVGDGGLWTTARLAFVKATVLARL